LAEQTVQALRWMGSEQQHLDEVVVARCGSVVVGCYGGNVGAGADKNEDAALVWRAHDWEFAVLVDAHFSSQSAALVLEAIEAERADLIECLSLPVSGAFNLIHSRLLAIFLSREFRAKCRRVVGEASCLICARKEGFLWWMCIGDVVVYVLHPELAMQGQFALNQRSYFEWVGRRNAFDLAVPCYASGVRQLHFGHSRIVMTTDGLLEYGERPFENPKHLYQFFRYHTDVETAVAEALRQVHLGEGRDSATIIAWDYSG